MANNIGIGFFGHSLYSRPNELYSFWPFHMKVARIYLRVSTVELDLTLQADIEHSTRAAGYYAAGVYREKASDARADRSELLRKIADLQP